MSNIIIEVDGKTVPYVQVDLRFRESNNSFTDELELPHAKWPIRIPENDETVLALGSSSISSARKVRNYDCVIIVGQNRYDGVLEIIDYFKTYRKADLSYSSPVKNILSSKLYEFMPSINLLGDDPVAVPFTNKSDVPFNAQDEMNNYAVTNKVNTFPQVQWNLPVLSHDDRIEEGKKDIGEDYAFYRDFINGRDTVGDLFINDFTVTTTEFEVRNRNIICPKVFVMAPVLNALQSIGYTLKGSATFHPLLKSLLFYSEEDQMTEIQLRTPGTPFSPLTPNWQFVWFTNQTHVYQKTANIITTDSGEFNINLDIEWQLGNFNGTWARCFVTWQGNSIFSTSQIFNPQELKEKIPLTVASSEIGDEILFTIVQFSPSPVPTVSLELVKNQNEGLFYDVHPTIDFRRYLPDWTIADLITNLKLFNVKSIIDDVSKEFSLVFNESDYLFKRDYVIIKGSRDLSSFKNITNDRLALRYANEDDNYITITQDETVLNGVIDTRTGVFSSEFNVVPHDGITAVIDDTYLDKDGVGLLIYNPINAPRVSDSINNHSLSIDGDIGIYQSFHKAWMSLLLDGSYIPLTLNVTSPLLQQILSKQDLFVNGKRFLIVDADYQPLGINKYQLELQLISVNI